MQVAKKGSQKAFNKQDQKKLLQMPIPILLFPEKANGGHRIMPSKRPRSANLEVKLGIIPNAAQRLYSLEVGLKCLTAMLAPLT